MLYEGLKVLKTMMVTAALSATLVVGADAAELKGGIVDTGTLNFRSAPSESAPIIDKLYNGYRVCILDVDENGWASISINGNPGYVSAEYLDVLDVMDVKSKGAAPVSRTMIFKRLLMRLNAQIGLLLRRPFIFLGFRPL